MSSKTKISDPVRFAETIFGCKLWSMQQDILHSIENHRRVAVKSGHASGKTFCAAIAALWFAARYPDSRVLVIAPGWLQVRSVLWSEIHALLQRARYKLPTTAVTQTELHFSPRNMIIGISTNDAARLQGHHAEHLLIICDEAPGI